jgi:plasmid stability protein
MGAEQMAQILVRGLDDAPVARLKDRARQNHRSLQGEVRTLLEEAAAPLASRSEALAIVDKWQRFWKEQGKTFSDSAEIIRRMRDA